MLVLYSSLVLAALMVGAPYWLARMAVSERYRAGLSERLGAVPEKLRAQAAGRNVVWLHAVSVGEMIAATRLVQELEQALPGWLVLVSTTTATGQRVAQERFGAGRVFFYPLDLGWAVRAYLHGLQPKLLVLMESELWPAMLAGCTRRGGPVAVVNARVSDRSFARGVRLRRVWGRVLRLVSLFAAQSTEDARRLVEMGARENSVLVSGNLKYEVHVPEENRVADLVRDVAAGRPVIVAGSTVARKSEHELSEEEMVIQAWEDGPRKELGAMLVLAPRHPERFAEVESVLSEFRLVKISDLLAGGIASDPEIVLLDTIGDLAAVYGQANVAFVGGSLVARGGHNPLEPAQFGVPVVMGSSYENFRDVVGRMKAMEGLQVVEDVDGLRAAVMDLLENREKAWELGRRGRAAFEAQAGATARTVKMLVELATVGR